MFFLETTPDTSNYLIAGYGVALIVLTGYLVSLIVRWRNLRQELDLLEQTKKDPK